MALMEGLQQSGQSSNLEPMSWDRQLLTPYWDLSNLNPSTKAYCLARTSRVHWPGRNQVSENSDRLGHLRDNFWIVVNRLV